MVMMITPLPRTTLTNYATLYNGDSTKRDTFDECLAKYDAGALPWDAQEEVINSIRNYSTIAEKHIRHGFSAPEMDGSKQRKHQPGATRLKVKILQSECC